MKKLLFIFSFFLVSIASVIAEDYRKTLLKHDLTQYINKEQVKTSNDFWLQLRQKYPLRQDYYDALVKETSLSLRIEKEFGKNDKEYEDLLKPFYNFEITDDYPEVKEIEQLFNKYSGYPCSIHILLSNEDNGFALPSGDIFVYDHIWQNLTYDEKVALISHEYCHYVLEHAKVCTWRNEITDRRSMIWGTIIVAASEVASGWGAGMTGQEYHPSEESITAQLNSFARGAYSTRLARSREQEIEADIIAYRYLDFIGKNPESMIALLEKLPDYVEESNNSDHPTNKERIGILSQIKGTDFLYVHGYNKPRLSEYSLLSECGDVFVDFAFDNIVTYDGLKLNELRMHEEWREAEAKIKHAFIDSFNGKMIKEKSSIQLIETGSSIVRITVDVEKIRKDGTVIGAIYITNFEGAALLMTPFEISSNSKGDTYSKIVKSVELLGRKYGNHICETKRQ